MNMVAIATDLLTDLINMVATAIDIFNKYSSYSN